MREVAHLDDATASHVKFLEDTNDLVETLSKCSFGHDSSHGRRWRGTSNLKGCVAENTDRNIRDLDLDLPPLVLHNR